MKKHLILVSAFLLVALVVGAQEMVSYSSVDSLINAILKQTNDINAHTDSWGESNRIYTGLTVLASLFSIIAGVAAGAIWWQRHTSRRTQLAIIDDLTRHFLANLMRINNVDNDHTPAEIVFRRLAVLSDDLNLNRFTVKTSDYRLVHQIELYTRNYNIHAEWLAVHYDSLSPEKQQEYKTELLHRGFIIAASLDSLRSHIFSSYDFWETEEEKCTRVQNLINLFQYKSQSIPDWESMSNEAKYAYLKKVHAQEQANQGLEQYAGCCLCRLFARYFKSQTKQAPSTDK